MMQRTRADFWNHTGEILHRLHCGGVLCTVTDRNNMHNVLTLGWGQIGPFYHEHPIFIIAVTPLRYSWRFLEEVPEFTISVPDDNLKKAVNLCGSMSGREGNKFELAGLTTIPGLDVSTVSLQECPLNIECRIYEKIKPPHMLLTPERREKPVNEQHTIYFAEVLGSYVWQD